ncbi:Transcriptional regulator of acetoin/glycerol metabolism [Halobacillus karajensis]|uniref:Acetoin dehydrogenase operon transcriptional activator AcoR n=1 Tax=Halobacillus karajensis TaxID=195088 RepID=A0A024P894_9BACI|nr:sigma-54-dependent Fis family transcriptional regulator [Halobacillus karajensis]CDQ18215.1 Acetoin dehydrogenase operon transcriptional activator AcoR [Halobacillus karajensis]CDQ24567.1 Acetoin dehydrogenase operon transcriptional activator AcoR [Halobacillus karajensis]CDQ29186.1 Acetoin dehydrogenase operon transcriptional activator AcoR [Halobacillus karajensis]SEH57055.1 Transcriptional regulator of acetoin/glycerol metabolism [Halobacillus karajensis]
MLGQITKADWKRFVQKGVLDDSRISDRIAASWNKCMQIGVDPYNGKGSHLLSGEEFKKRRRENKHLIDVAEPFINKLAVMYQNSDVILMLVDRDGYVLRMIGESKVKAVAEDINFTEGVKWTEEQVGTNAIGTTLAIQEPITINGMAHFSIASQSWSCSASPIKDEQGEIIGALDISSPHVPSYHEHLLATVVTTTYAIESSWKSRINQEKLELINYGLKVQQESSEPFMIFNRHDQMIYQSPSIDVIPEFPNQGLPEGVKKTPVYSEESPEIIGHYVSWSGKSKEASIPGWNPAFSFQGVTGKSQSFQSVLQRAEKAMHSDVTIHISGETGTGKEVMARSLHDCTECDTPFVAVNCGALPENLLESELFGYVGGAFTGAQKGGYDGKIIQANGGTLFLDEIGDISSKTQIALLRTLQEKQVIPIGGKKAIPVSFRLITATNQPLRELVKNGTFREDLYYRIYVYPIKMPPLRERLEDLPDLIRYYFHKQNWRFNWSKEAVKALQRYHWPGNIRELFNVLEGLQTETDTYAPDPRQIESYIRQITPFEFNQPLPESLSYREQMEKDYIVKALKQHGGKVSAAAQQLGIPRSTFYRKLKKYKLDR